MEPKININEGLESTYDWFIKNRDSFRGNRNLKMIRPIIIAGGIGTRLWPMSSKVLPKQFMKVNSQKSLFQETLSRIASKKLKNQ